LREIPEDSQVDTRPSFPRVDRTVLSVASLFDAPDEPGYWRLATPGERLRAVELIRRSVYGYSEPAAGLQRVLEVAQLVRR
jgi:hypothetical protein